MSDDIVVGATTTRCGNVDCHALHLPHHASVRLSDLFPEARAVLKAAIRRGDVGEMAGAYQGVERSLLEAARQFADSQRSKA